VGPANPGVEHEAPLDYSYISDVGKIEYTEILHNPVKGRSTKPRTDSTATITKGSIDGNRRSHRYRQHEDGGTSYRKGAGLRGVGDDSIRKRQPTSMDDGGYYHPPSAAPYPDDVDGGWDDGASDQGVYLQIEKRSHNKDRGYDEVDNANYKRGSDENRSHYKDRGYDEVDNADYKRGSDGYLHDNGKDTCDKSFSSKKGSRPRSREFDSYEKQMTRRQRFSQNVEGHMDQEQSSRGSRRQGSRHPRDGPGHTGVEMRERGRGRRGGGSRYTKVVEEGRSSARDTVSSTSSSSSLALSSSSEVPYSSDADTVASETEEEERLSPWPCLRVEWVRQSWDAAKESVSEFFGIPEVS